MIGQFISKQKVSISQDEYTFKTLDSKIIRIRTIVPCAIGLKAKIYIKQICKDFYHLTGVKYLLDDPDFLESTVDYIFLSVRRLIRRNNIKKLFNYCYSNNISIETVLTSGPDTIARVLRISKSISKNIVDAYNCCTGRNTLLYYFWRYGISTNLINDILNDYCSETNAINAIKANPFILYSYGASFKSCDEIHLDLGLPQDNANRISTSIMDTIAKSEMFGHAYISVNDVISLVTNQLGVNKTIVFDAIPMC